MKSDRRNEERPDAESRRRDPRPALWLNLLVLVLGLAGLVLAQQHRRRLDARFARMVNTHKPARPLEKTTTAMANRCSTEDDVCAA